MCIDPGSTSCMAETPDSEDTTEIIADQSDGYKSNEAIAALAVDTADAAHNHSHINATSEMSTQSHTLAPSIASSTSSTNSSTTTRPQSEYWKVSLEKFLNIHADRTVSILDHEFVFWLGDMNYRISEEAAPSVRRE